jgi:hypothetical protein
MGKNRFAPFFLKALERSMYIHPSAFFPHHTGSAVTGGQSHKFNY